MKKPIAIACAPMLACMLAACASLTPEGSRVKVYEADLATPAAARRLPEGCRLLATTPPADQMESERHLDDPYRRQRNDAGSRGGNVLLVLSDRFVTRYKTDCASSDTSPDCQNRAQNWYKVSFESYACDPAALQTLSQLPAEGSGSIASWWPFGKKAPAASAAAPKGETAPAAPASVGGLAPSELKAKILLLLHEGVGNDVLVAYVKSHPLRGTLSAEEIVDWKRSGIADPVIEAVVSGAPSAR